MNILLACVMSFVFSQPGEYVQVDVVDKVCVEGQGVGRRAVILDVNREQRKPRYHSSKYDQHLFELIVNADSGTVCDYRMQIFDGTDIIIWNFSGNTSSVIPINNIPSGNTVGMDLMFYWRSGGGSCSLDMSFKANNVEQYSRMCTVNEADYYCDGYYAWRAP